MQKGYTVNWGVTRLDGARDKKQVCRPHVRTCRRFGSKCTVLKKVLGTFLRLFGARGVVPPLPPPYAPDGQRKESEPLD